VRRAARKAKHGPAPKDANLHLRYNPAEAAAYAVSRGAPTYSALHKILHEVRARSARVRHMMHDAVSCGQTSMWLVSIEVVM
jgi:hypothetical protein